MRLCINVWAYFDGFLALFKCRKIMHRCWNWINDILPWMRGWQLGKWEENFSGWDRNSFPKSGVAKGFGDGMANMLQSGGKIFLGDGMAKYFGGGVTTQNMRLGWQNNLGVGVWKQIGRSSGNWCSAVLQIIQSFNKFFPCKYGEISVKNCVLVI